MENYNEISKLVNKDADKALEIIDLLLSKDKKNIELFCLKISALEALDRIPEALNTLNLVLEIDAKHKEALVKREFLQTIMHYRNTDIYASTNLWHDPWFE